MTMNPNFPRPRGALRQVCRLALASALVSQGCIQPEELTEDVIPPPGGAPEAVFPRVYTDILLGHGIRTVTGGRLAHSCVELPAAMTFTVANTSWSSEGSAVANQTELATKFSLDTNLAVEHGPASANLGLKIMRELDWSANAFHLIIKATYSYDVILNNTNLVALDQASYNIIAPPAMGDNAAMQTARARDFLKRCGRYWTKGVKKGGELYIIYSFRNTSRATRDSLTTTARGAAPVHGNTNLAGSVDATQQNNFRTAVQNATLKVYAEGFRVNMGDPLMPITMAMTPGANNQLASLAGFFNDLKTSVNTDHTADQAPMANPITSNGAVRKVALIGQSYQSMFRAPRAAGSPPAPWSGAAATDLVTQDTNLHTVTSQYTDHLKAARAAARTAGFMRALSGQGDWNFENAPERSAAAIHTRLDTLRDTVRVVENGGVAAPRNAQMGLDTASQETGYWARRCWDLIELGNDDANCYVAGPFLAQAQAALTAFRNGLPKPLNHFSVWWRLIRANTYFGPYKSDDDWRWADKVCREHRDAGNNAALNLKLPSDTELDAFGAFLNENPQHTRAGIPGMDFARRYLWESRRFIAWEKLINAGWVSHDHSRWGAGDPDYPFTCIRPAGPFAMPLISF